MVEISACVNFCNIKREIGSFILFNIASDCKIVDIPPKPITKEHASTFPMFPKEDEMSIQPLVISIMPSKIEANFGENKLKNGEREDITTKNIVMTTPIERTEIKVS